MTNRSYSDFRALLDKMLPELDFSKPNHPVFGVEWWDPAEGGYHTHISISDHNNGSLSYRYADRSTGPNQRFTGSWRVEISYSVLTLSWRKIGAFRHYPVFGIVETEGLNSGQYPD
jgi:hypothetical protein